MNLASPETNQQSKVEIGWLSLFFGTWSCLHVFASQSGVLVSVARSAKVSHISLDLKQKPIKLELQARH